jgi:uncharacterized protein YegP (UPF0339 family)
MLEGSTVEMYKDFTGAWHWRLLDDASNAVADSSVTYETKEECKELTDVVFPGVPTVSRAEEG